MSVFCVIIALQFLVSYYVINQIQRAGELKDRVHNLEVKALEIRNSNLNYFNQESKNLDYFATGRSEYLWRSKHLYQEVKKEFVDLAGNEQLSQMNLTLYLESARMSFYKYQTYFHEIEVRQLTQGYGHFGLIGQMNQELNVALAKNQIEEINYLQIKTLQQEFNTSGKEKLADSLKKYVQNLADLTSGPHTLNDYLSLFQHYLNQANEIGLDHSSGLYKALFKEAEILDKKLTKLTIKFQSRYQKQIWTLVAILGASASIIIALSIVLSLVLARSLSKPISLLAQRINSYFSSNKIERDLPQSSAREVVMLNNTFNALIAQVEKQVKQINDEKQKALEQNKELTQLNAELDRFIYHTSHDLRAPLTSIAGLIEVVELSDEENIYDYLNHMKFCINQLDHTIVEIIHFYKNRSSDIRSDELNLSKITSVVIDQNRFHPDAKKIEFINELNKGLTVLSDGYRFNIILGNLISNAIKYSDSNKVHSYVRIWSETSPDSLHVHIEDNGIGISQEHLTKIFKMFYRASDKSTGSGLGLYITAESCKKIGAQIEIESELGEYTRITLKIPLITVSQTSLVEYEEAV